MKLFKDIKFPDTYKYSSDSDHIPLEFYEEVFPISKKIDLLLGYFSSNAIKVLSKSFAEFVYHGGEMRIITNHIFSLKDKENLLEYSLIDNENKVINIFNDLENLEKELSGSGQHFFDCLRYLQKKGRLKIQPVKFNKFELSHSKSMILYDGEEYISTDGSINFTLPGLIKNSESFEVNVPWEGAVFSKRIKEDRNRFDLIFNQEHPGYTFLDAKEVEAVINKIGKEKDITDLLEDSIDEQFDFSNKSKNDLYKKKVQLIIAKKRKRFAHIINDLKGLPRFPYTTGPRQYQKDAYKAWVKNNYKGIFAMATGTGKTITALNCILEEYQKDKSYKVVILVPTISLVGQWEKELKSFNFYNIIKVSSKDDWESDFSRVNLLLKLKKSYSFVIITTYATFHRDKFQNYFKKLPKTTTIIADEAHNLGGKKILKLLSEIKLEKRIGLSATPKRVYDQNSNMKIEEFFNDLPPYTYNYSMKMAIDNGVLTKYEYFPHIVNLTDDELNEYSKISLQLQKFFNFEENNFERKKIVEILLLKRKRIIHKALNKSIVFKQIINEEFKRRGNLNYSLVYVPEGVKPDYYLIDEDKETDEDILLIDEFTRVVSSVDDSITVNQFTGKTKNKGIVLDSFTKGKTKVLTSMKCLDEGVDIPRTELAFFCSSTGNPRQFIQRRGRILRKHNDKIKATIHDLIVIPKLFNSSDITYEMERGLVKKELERVVSFSFLSMNKYHTINILKKIYQHYKLSLFEIEDELISNEIPI